MPTPEFDLTVKHGGGSMLWRSFPHWMLPVHWESYFKCFLSELMNIYFDLYVLVLVCPAYWSFLLQAILLASLFVSTAHRSLSCLHPTPAQPDAKWVFSKTKHYECPSWQTGRPVVTSDSRTQTESGVEAKALQRTDRVSTQRVTDWSTGR